MSATAIRILINDYCGHPFQVELSRELAKRGYYVQHIYSADDVTPRGDLKRNSDDAATFLLQSVSTGERLQKYSLIRRRIQEVKYGDLICREIRAWRPHLVVGSNNPLEAQRRIVRVCSQLGIPFIYWLQDIHSQAIRSIMRQKLPVLGVLIGWWYELMERRLLRRADHVIAIADAFRPQLQFWQVPPSRISVVENWAPVDKIPMLASDTDWRREHALCDKRIALYTGTIGLKHNPDLLLIAAEALADHPDLQIVVVSEGKYADYLKHEIARRNRRNLLVFPFQSFERYPAVLASADVLVAMIEPDAAFYSVPSKVLSYLCSGRPTVLAADRRNLAAIILERCGGGIVVDPRDSAAFVGAIRQFLADEGASREAGLRGRRYAEENFRIAKIADRFETVFARTLAGTVESCASA